jgi:hypothetical protein
MDLIHGRLLSGILVELKEEYTPRVAFQERKVSFVPYMWQIGFWEMQIKEKFVLRMWQGGTLHSELQPNQKERY